MLADLRNAVRAATGRGGARILPLAVLLTVLVVLTAGLAGTAQFTGARWNPWRATATQKIITVIVHAKAPLLLRPGKRVIVKPGPTHVPLGVVIGLIAAFVAAVAILVWLWWRRREVHPDPTIPAVPNQTTDVVLPEPTPEPQALMTGIELALQALDDEREPADAVVRAWLGLQETAQESGIVRYPSETPTEFATRVLTRAFPDARPLRTLLRLYLRTRFSDHPVTAEDVTDVRAALEQLLAGWRRTGSATRSGVR